MAPLLAGLKGTEPIADDILIDGCRDTEEEATHDHDANSDSKTHQGGCVPSYTQVGCAGGMIRTQKESLCVREYWAIRDEISAQACYRQAHDTLYWPNMQGEIKDCVQQCSVCNEYAHEQQKETMMSHPLTKCPWHSIPDWVISDCEGQFDCGEFWAFARE